MAFSPKSDMTNLSKLSTTGGYFVGAWGYETQIINSSGAFIGSISPSSPILLPSGTLALPSLAFASNVDTGIYLASASLPALSIDGVQMLKIDALGNTDLGYNTAQAYNSANTGNELNFHGQTLRVVSARTSGVAVAALNRKTSSKTADAFLKPETESSAGSAYLFLSRNATGFNLAHATSGNLVLFQGASGTGGTVRMSLDGSTAAFTFGNTATTAVHTVNGQLTCTADSTSELSWIFRNSNNSNTAAHSAIKLRSGGTSGGDAYIQLRVTGGSDWSLGNRNSDSDSFVIAQGSSLVATNYFKITTGGIVNIGSGSGTKHVLNTLTATTVGAAGAASALPANPTGYVVININGTDRKIPYYAT